MAVARQVEQDGLGLALGLAAQRFVDRAAHRMGRFRRRHDALGAGELHASLEALHLMIGLGLDQAEFIGVRHHRAHAVIAQTTGVEAGRHERGAERVHLHQRRHLRGVAEVVGVFAAGQGRASRRLDRHDATLAATAQMQTDERERQTGEVRAAARAGDHHVRIIASHFHLLDGFFADDGLVQHHMVQHRAERVFHVGVLHRDFYRFRNRHAERAGAVRVLGENGAAALGLVRRRGDAAGAIGLHQRAAIRLLIIGDAHLEHGDVDAEQRAGERQRRAPLPGAGFGRQLLDAGLLVVPGLRHGGVGLVRARGRDAFILVVDLRRGIERLFETARTHQRRGTPQLEHVADRIGNLDVTLGRNFLENELHREQRLEIRRSRRLLGAGMKHRGHRRREVRVEVVPGFGNGGFVEQVFDLIAHATLQFSLSEEVLA